MSQNAIIGESYGVDIPETKVSDRDLTEERKMAKFSRTAEFARIREHLESRIAFFQTHLPNGDITRDPKKAGEDWAVANAIIAEFRAILQAYEDAQEVVKNAQ